MGATKYEVYTQEAIDIAELFKAFAHPARVMVVIQLLEADADKTTLSTLLEEIKLSQSALSKHVEKLRKNGILTTRLEQRGSKCYQVLGINKVVMNDFRRIVLKIFSLSKNHQSSSMIGYANKINSTKLNQWLMSGVT